MKKFQSFGQGCSQSPECIICCFQIFICFPETNFRHLNVPVAEFIPQEVINFLYSDSKLVFIHIVCNITDYGVQLGKDPFVFKAEIIQICRLSYSLALQIHHNETGCIPDFVCKITAGLYTFPVETHVISRCITCDQSQSKCICAVFINNFQRIDTISERFTHLTSL